MKVQKAVVALVEEKRIPLDKAASFDKPESGWKLLSITGKPGKKEVLVRQEKEKKTVSLEEAVKLEKEGYQIISTYFDEIEETQEEPKKKTKGGK